MRRSRTTGVSEVSFKGRLWIRLPVSIQRQVVVVGANRVGMSLHEEDFRRIAGDRLLDRFGDHNQPIHLVG
jgi:hypothetical protein